MNDPVQLARDWLSKPLPKAKITAAGIRDVARELVRRADAAEECKRDEETKDAA